MFLHLTVQALQIESFIYSYCCSYSMKTEEDKSAFLKYFGDTPKLKFIDFLIGNYFFDFNLTDMARGASISYNSLMGFFGGFLEKGIIIKTRKVGKSDMYKFNTDNITARRMLQFAWFLTEQDLGVGVLSDETQITNLQSTGINMPSSQIA